MERAQYQITILLLFIMIIIINDIFRGLANPEGATVHFLLFLQNLVQT